MQLLLTDKRDFVMSDVLEADQRIMSMLQTGPSPWKWHLLKHRSCGKGCEVPYLVNMSNLRMYVKRHVQRRQIQGCFTTSAAPSDGTYAYKANVISRNIAQKGLSNRDRNVRSKSKHMFITCRIASCSGCNCSFSILMIRPLRFQSTTSSIV